MRRNMSSFRVFGPDETASNRLTAIYAASKKTWLAEYKPEDADGGELDVSGRVMEMLSEHTLEGWFEGYVLTGRHGFFSSYEAFVHVIDSMFNQHAKWLEKSKGGGLACSSAVYEHPHHLPCVAAGSQRLHSSRPWIP
jgi:xylulose-5-phosphate/fructose-6-phosphate phosphoketolase